MDLDRSRVCLERAEASLRDAAERLIQSPLDPEYACVALESAKIALQTLRRERKPGDRVSAHSFQRMMRQANRVRRLLEGAAMFSFRGLAARAEAASYTPSGEIQPVVQPERFVLQG